MEFDLEKKGYSRAQVQAYLARREQETRRTLDDQLDRIRALREENDLLNAKLDEYYKRERLIGNALIAAVAKAEEIEHDARTKYTAELAALKSFHEKWLEYYQRILKKYPLDGTLERGDKLNAEITGMLEQIHADAPAEQEMSEVVRKTVENSAPSAPLPKPRQVDAIKPEVRAQYADESKRLSAGGINMTAVSEALAEASEEDDRFEELAAKWATGIAPQEVTDYLDTQVDARTGVNPQALKTPSDTGFSFEEALHPTEDLGDIMQGLGFEVQEQKPKKGKRK